MLNYIPKRVYVDTSVFGGYFEPEFDKATISFFDAVNSGKLTVLVSPLTLAELQDAPPKVVALLRGTNVSHQEILADDDRVDFLRDAYLKAKVVTSKSRNDAEHIAWASVHRADALVSWNFKHIVQLDRIRGFHSVNLRFGYPLVPIHSPQEVIPYDE